MRLCGPQQIALAASDIKPGRVPGIHSFARREVAEHVDFSRQEKLGSGGKVLAHRIVEQFLVFGREAVKFLIHTHIFGHRISTLCGTAIRSVTVDSLQQGGALRVGVKQ